MKHFCSLTAKLKKSQSKTQNSEVLPKLGQPFPRPMMVATILYHVPVHSVVYSSPNSKLLTPHSRPRGAKLKG